jgi:excisionase family DNA binding protein
MSQDPVPDDEEHSVVETSDNAQPSIAATEELSERYLVLAGENRDREFLSTTRAAELTGKARRTIQFWVEIGVVEAVFVGNKCWISVDSLKRYLRRRADKHAA